MTSHYRAVPTELVDAARNNVLIAPDRRAAPVGDQPFPQCRIADSVTAGATKG
ncbi:hypothetical protein [Streptomyces sp. MA5143a]|uniref:hypothetical protein n=1 Tax=Streptomyces sp. MA5143a TaxID=2083010 RepID=UPI0015E78778|nr:hypothetical protein [Streptomyces sp. MA5143a]